MQLVYHVQILDNNPAPITINEKNSSYTKINDTRMLWRGGTPRPWCYLFCLAWMLVLLKYIQSVRLGLNR
jgi:hypothetical protein